MTPAITITATVMKPTVENGAWVNRPFVLTVTPSGFSDKPAIHYGGMVNTPLTRINSQGGISDKLAAESAAKAGKK